MGTDKNRMPILKKVLIILPVIIVIMIVGQFIYIHYFNSQVHVLNGAEEKDGVSVEIVKKDEATSSWLKRGYDLYGTIVDLKAQTMDVNFVNNSKLSINQWEMRVNIEEDFLLNQAWCGIVEIHQHVSSGDEKVQTLDLRDFSLSDVTLDYLYDGDMLIPLSKGDYVIYYPSEKLNEMPVNKNSQFTMGFILYYLQFPSETNYEVTYTFHTTIFDGYGIYLIGTLILIWLIELMFFIVSDATYKKTVKEMEIKKSGILSLSDMYSIIYIIDIRKDELIPVVADEDSENIRPKNMSASGQLRNMFEYDSIESYKEVAIEFCDFDTLEQRLDGKNTIAFEYVSSTYGWCRVRFFAMDRGEDNRLERVVFAIQVINDEKKEIENIIHRADNAEHESKAKSIFLANMSHEIRTPINTIIGLNTMILRESKEPTIRSYAKNVNSASNMLLSLINGILDVSKIEADKMELVPEEYSFKQLLNDIANMVKTRAEFDRLEFKCDVSEIIPDKLYGDKVRLQQVIINLITNAAKYTDEGSVKLSVFGKMHNDMVHILVSVKDTGIGIREEDLNKLTQRFTRFDEKRNHSVEGTGIGLNLVTGILGLMNSELHVLSEYGQGSEFYFEIEQKVIDETPIGKYDFNENNDAEDEYQALFTAPDAKILVVDDNAMNLTVFEELLKETELQIDAVSSGRIALNRTAEKKYDLIFMDHMMPDMDGVETFNRIRSQSGGKNIDTPVIVLTANALKGAKEEYCQIGFNDFLAKPIQPDALEKQIMTYLDQSKIKKNTAVIKKKASEEATLPVISGVDVAYGLTHTGGIKSYMSVIKQFVNVADAEVAELKTYIEAITEDNNNYEAIKNFRIKIHAMKSSANVMGGLLVYGMAAMLEDAAVHEDIKEILDIAPYFINEWLNLKESVAIAMPQTKEKHAKPSKEAMVSLLHMLETSMKAYDIKSADSVMEKLQSFEWNDNEAVVIDELATAVSGLDVDKALDLCETLNNLL